MFIRAKKNGDRIYLQIVSNERIEGKVVQRVHHTLGRLDLLRVSGELDSLLRSGLKFSEKLTVLDAHEHGESITTKKLKIGACLLFERLWEEYGIKAVLQEYLGERRFVFVVERIIFITVLHRLIAPGSDRAAEQWIKSYAVRGIKEVALHHCYRAMGWLGGALPAEEQTEGTPVTPRCVKDQIEEELFARRRNLFSEMSLVFFDTTTLYFEGEGGATLGQYGHPNPSTKLRTGDHRPDLKQMVVGVVLDGEGNAVCSELLPGNTADITTLMPVAQRLKHRFGVVRVCMVADRGMISKKTMDEIEELGWEYILGVRMRKTKEVRERALSQGGRYHEVYPPRQKANDPSPLKVKEVQIEGRRYIVCHNEEEARKDAYDRELIVASLREKLKRGDKSLIGNKGYRRYLKTQKEHFAIDEAKIEEEERFDGKWVLRTNTDFSAVEVALKYKQLWMVEDIFRTMKSILETRPIYHHHDDTIKGHVFCSFLALLLRKYLQDRLEEKGWHLEWADIIRDVDDLEEIEITFRNKSFVLRSEAKGVAGKVFQVVQVALPPVLREK